MKTLMTICATAIALAIPAGALANDGQGDMGHHHGWMHHHNSLAMLSGTGTSFGGATATATGTVKGDDPVGTGTFSATLTTNWTASETKTSDNGSLSCAPATATIAVTGAVTANTAGASLTGKTCAWTKSDGTVVRTFFGNGSLTAAGTLALLNGKTGKAFLFQKADGTVTGGLFAGRHEGQDLTTFSVREHTAAHLTGDCDHNK